MRTTEMNVLLRKSKMDFMHVQWISYSFNDYNLSYSSCNVSQGQERSPVSFMTFSRPHEVVSLGTKNKIK